jgi:zeta-carotene desaturase
VGIDHFLAPQQGLNFMTSDGRLSRLEANGWSAPFHLFRSFARAHYLGWSDKLLIAWGLFCLQRALDKDDPSFSDWLRAHKQTPRTIDRFWGLVLTSALNETPDRIGLRYARKVFVDGLLRDRHGWVVYLPTVPLSRLYGDELQDWYRQYEVGFSFNAAIRNLAIRENSVTHAETRLGEQLSADWYISTVPFERFLEILPEEVINSYPYFANLRQLETSPITSVHLWYDRPLTDLPHLVLVDGFGQWVFNHGSTSNGEHYLQVVVSAARQFRGLGHEELQRRIVEEMARLFPAAGRESLKRARVVTEHAATFSALPGVDRWRPPQRSPIDNLFLAGDWTATGWPATMEGAVRSGYLAAEALLNCAELQKSSRNPATL